MYTNVDIIKMVLSTNCVNYCVFSLKPMLKTISDFICLKYTYLHTLPLRKTKTTNSTVSFS